MTFPYRDGTYGAQVQHLTASEMRTWRAYFALKPEESVQVALRGTRRDGLGHLQRPLLQVRRPLQRQRPHGNEVLPRSRPNQPRRGRGREPPCGHCGVVFPTAEHCQTHALTIKDRSAGGSTYNTHNVVLEAVANSARYVGAAYSVGATCNGVRNTDANCRLGAYTKPDGTRCVKHADIAFLNMPHGAFNAQRVYGDITHRAVVGMTAGRNRSIEMAPQDKY